jgi:phytoene dehydrogenase-like protein
MKRHDGILIGGGHNGLVAAGYLQRAGLDGLVVEQNPWVGGAATSRDTGTGVTFSNCSDVCSLFRPEIMRDLELPKHGLQIIAYEGGAVFTQDGDDLASDRNHDAHRRAFARFSARDGAAYESDARDVTRQCRFLQPLLMRTAPDPVSFKPRDIAELPWIAAGSAMSAPQRWRRRCGSGRCRFPTSAMSISKRTW